MTPEKNRATAINNMHKNLVKIARVVPEISARIETHAHTHVLTTILGNRSRECSNETHHSLPKQSMPLIYIVTQQQHESLRTEATTANKLAPYETDGRLLQMTFLPSSMSRETKTRPNIKNPALQNLHIVY